jgi:uncharacterized protein (TIGR02246 family)
MVIMTLGSRSTIAQDETAEIAEHVADRLAIEKLTNHMIQAFDKRDAAAIAAHWTEQGEFIRDDNEPILGRANIEKGYGEFFKTLKGKPKLAIQTDGVRFPSADIAIAEITLRLKNDDGQLMASGRQEIVAVRERGQWKVAVIREWDRDVGMDADLKDLDWLIGTWQAVINNREVKITYEWDENKAFIRGKYCLSEDANPVESGIEMIGKDNSTGMIRSWLFQSDGGFSGASWTRDGKKWSVDCHSVRPDGREMTATIIYVQVDPNTITWQAINQAFEDVPVASTPPIKVTKLGQNRPIPGQ